MPAALKTPIHSWEVAGDGITQEGKRHQARSQEAWVWREPLPHSDPCSSSSNEDAGPEGTGGRSWLASDPGA